MNQSHLRLGQALAFVEAEIMGRTVPPGNLPEADRAWIEALHTAYKRIAADGAALPILQNLPPTICTLSDSHLDNNEDFFISYLLVLPPAGDVPDICPDLFMHFNSCFHCFVEMSTVYRDFYHQRQLFQ